MVMTDLVGEINSITETVSALFYSMVPVYFGVSMIDYESISSYMRIKRKSNLLNS